MIKKFTPTTGKYIERITGQDRLAFAMSDNEDLYDLIAWSKQGGYQGAVLFFYDFETGEVYQPFEKKRNVVYGRPECIFREICASVPEERSVFFARPKCTKLQVRNVHLCMYILYIVAVVRYYPDTLQTFRF